MRRRARARRRGRRRWWVRVLVGLAVTLVTLGLVALGLVAIVLGTSAGTRWALRQGVAWYGESIAGHVSFEDSDGALADELCLRGLLLADGREQPLLRVESLCVRPRLAALFGRTVELERLSLAGVELHVWPDGAWGDLAPPSPAPPPDEPPGPDLPVRITAPLEIDGLEVIGHTEVLGEALDTVPDAPGRRYERASLVSAAWLHAELEAEGRGARVVVRSLGGHAPVIAASVEDGQLGVRWDSPVLVLEQLTLRSSLGIVEAASGRLDVTRDHLRYAAELRATAWLPVKEGSPPLRVPAELRVEGSDRAAAASGRILAPTLGRAELSVLADLHGVTRMSGLVHAVPDPSLRIPPVRAWIAVTAPEDEPLLARLMAFGPGVVLAATWDGARARAQAYVDGARVDASALVQEGQLRRVEGLVVVASAARATAAIDGLVPIDVPRLAGAGRAAAACHVGAEWRCALQAAVRQGADHVEAEAEIDAGGDALGIRLQRLTGRLRGEPVRLVGPVHASVGDDSASLTPLRLAIAGGTIEAAGRLAWRGRSSLEGRIASLDLGVIQRFAPDVPLGGRLGATLSAHGDARSPTLRAAVGVTGLRWGDERLGEVLVHAEYERQRARADVEWRCEGSRVFARADVPLTLGFGSEDGERSTFAWRERAAVEASVDVERLALADVSRWVGGPELGGTVSATVRASGRLRDPIVEVELDGRELRLEDRAIGRARVSATASDGSVLASLDLHGPAIDEAHVEATLPVALRPTRGGAEYHARGRHELAVRLAGLDLDALEPWLGHAAPDLAGHVRGHAQASAEAGDVRGRVELLGYDLVLVGYDVGATKVTAELGDGTARARLVVSGPWARYAGLEARVPLALDGPLATPRLDPEAPISAHVELVDVELAGLGRTGSGPAIAGSLGGTLDVSGTLRRPTLDGELALAGLTHGDKPLGDVHLRTGYDGESLVATLEQHASTMKVVASGRVPLGVDLATPTFTWHRERPHRLSVRVSGLDRAALGPWVDLPEDLQFGVAARLEAHGTLADPHAVMQLRGHLRGHVDGEGSLPMPVSLQLELEPQRQDARLLLGAYGPAGLVVQAHADAPLAALLAGKGDPGAIEIDAVARAEDFDLRELSPLMPESLHDPRGRLTLEASAKGPISAPRLAGAIALHEGALTVVSLRQQFHDIELRARLDGPDIALERLTARSADGTASASAHLHLAPRATKGSAELTTHELPVVRPGLPAMRLDLRVRAELDATGDVTSLALRADRGFLDVLEMSPLAAAEPIPADDGVTYVDARGLAAQAKATQEAREPWLPRDVAFSLVLDDPLRVRGPSADMDWNGRFTLLRRTDAPPQATGEFRTEGGRVSLLGDDFEIERATIRFPETGDLDPFIDLVATTETPEATVTMILRGRTSRPQLELRSEPPMPESDVFALLVTGHADASQADQQEFSAKAASVLAAVNNPTLQRHLRDTIGIDRVGLGFGDTVDQPIVTVGKRVSDKLYLEAGYHHNAPRGVNEAELRLEYRFAPPRWSVETFFGDAAQGGIGLWWNRRFASRGQRAAERRAAGPGASDGASAPPRSDDGSR